MGKKIARSLVLVFFSALAFAQKDAGSLPEPATVGPVEAELVKPLNLRRLAVGSTVFARVTREWNGQGCFLREGATLEATVTLRESRNGRTPSRLALAFERAQCNGSEMKPIKLLLAAVAQPSANWQNDANTIFKLPNNPVFNPRSGQMAISTSGIDFGSMAPSLQLQSIVHHFPMSAKVQPGDVIGIRNMKLDLGTGPAQSSVLSARGRDVSLDAYTQLLLVPSSLVFARADLPIHIPAASDTSAPSAASAPAPQPPVNDLEVCAPPGCAVDLPVSAQELAGSSAASISIAPLGYTRRPAMMLSDFVHEDALAWLGPHQLLVAFNGHQLIHRHSASNDKAVHRVIRAVLLDTGTRTAIRALDWEITDDGSYLWPLPGNRLLAHVGNELRIYGQDLEVQRTVALAGPLAFVRLSPNGELMAIATLRERHSPELHARLAKDLFEQPEEDVDVSIFDSSFNTIAQASTISTIQPPTLINEGQVVLLSQPNDHYRMALRTWNSKAVTLARFTSLCTPQLSSMPPNLLFLLSCSPATNRPEYRVIRADGKLLMHGEARPGEIGQDAAAAQSGAAFALKSVHALGNLEAGMEFKGADLDAEELRVYSAADGKRLLAVRLDQPATSHGGYALSPDGAQLAVLSGSQIQLFSLALH